MFRWRCNLKIPRLACEYLECGTSGLAPKDVRTRWTACPILREGRIF